jgi:hypothetical protein
VHRAVVVAPHLKSWHGVMRLAQLTSVEFAASLPPVLLMRMHMSAHARSSITRSRTASRASWVMPPCTPHAQFVKVQWGESRLRSGRFHRLGLVEPSTVTSVISTWYTRYAMITRLLQGFQSECLIEDSQATSSSSTWVSLRRAANGQNFSHHVQFARRRRYCLGHLEIVVRELRPFDNGQDGLAGKGAKLRNFSSYFGACKLFAKCEESTFAQKDMEPLHGYGVMLDSTLHNPARDGHAHAHVRLCALIADQMASQPIEREPRFTAGRRPDPTVHRQLGSQACSAILQLLIASRGIVFTGYFPGRT